MKDINYFQRRGNDIDCFVKVYIQCRNNKFKIINDHVNNYMRQEHVDKKYYEELNKFRRLFFDQNYNETLLFLVEEYNELCLRFLKENKKVKHREASIKKNEVYHTMHDFMNHNNLCSDIKTYILSYIF